MWFKIHLHQGQHSICNDNSKGDHSSTAAMEVSKGYAHSFAITHNHKLVTIDQFSNICCLRIGCGATKLIWGRERELVKRWVFQPLCDGLWWLVVWKNIKLSNHWNFLKQRQNTAITCVQALELKQMQKMFLLKTMAGPGEVLIYKFYLYNSILSRVAFNLGKQLHIALFC